jgi:hypothetical protein
MHRIRRGVAIGYATSNISQRGKLLSVVGQVSSARKASAMRIEGIKKGVKKVDFALLELGLRCLYLRDSCYLQGTNRVTNPRALYDPVFRSPLVNIHAAKNPPHSLHSRRRKYDLAPQLPIKFEDVILYCTVLYIQQIEKQLIPYSTVLNKRHACYWIIFCGLTSVCMI